MWKSELKDWENVGTESYKFCLSQAEARLSSVLGNSEKITSRSYTLISIIIPIVAVCVGGVLNISSKEDKSYPIIILSIVSGLVLIGCLYFLITLIQKRDIWDIGIIPKDIVKSEYLEFDGLTNEETLKYLYLSQIEEVQHKIESNESVDKGRIETFNRCLWAIAILFFFVSIALICITIA
jgi:hypothetical protein